MKLDPEIIEKVRKLTHAAYIKIGAHKVEEKINLTLRFAQAQPTISIILDGREVTAVAVDIASVFDRECCYRQIEGPDGSLLKVETMQVLSIVITGEDVRLCKATYDVIPTSVPEKEEFVNARYWATTLDDLTENYFC